MTQLNFDQVRCAEVFCNATLENGMYRLWGDDPTALGPILECAIGTRLPERGTLTIDGVNPATTPQLRGEIGSLLPEEPTLPPGRVSVRMSQLQQLRGGPPSTALELLQTIGGGHLGDRLCQDLTANERRIVALALALALQAPKLVVLHTPFAIAGIDRRRVCDRLVVLAQRGVVVLAMPGAASLDFTLTEINITERRMQVNDDSARDQHLPEEGSVPRPVEFTILTSDAARLEAALLAEVTDAHCARFGPEELRVTTRDSSRLAHALVQVALRENVQIYATASKPAPPGASNVRPSATRREDIPPVAPSSNTAYGGYFPPPNNTGAS
jgi:ABC-type multidrug transport system ATPase subunit